MSIPPDFDELGEDLDVFYRIEPDGSVLLTGEKSMCILKRDLKDGSKIQGGINRGGMLFGERIALVNGQVVKYPLHWRDVAQPPSRLAVNERKPPPQLSPPKSIEDPVFNRDRPAFDKTLQQDLQKVAQATARPVDTQELRESQERIKKEVSKNSRSESGGPISQRMKALLGRRKGKETDTDTNLEALTEAADAIEKTMAEVERVREDGNRIAQELQQVQQMNEQLREELARVRAEARETLAQTTEEFGRKVKTRRWQVEAVGAHDVITEGMESKALEVEDPEGLMRYIVVSTAPRGTDQRTLSQWQTDLRSKVDLMPFGQRAVYVFAPENFKVHVLELVPGVDAEGAADQL